MGQLEDPDLFGSNRVLVTEGGRISKSFKCLKYSLQLCVMNSRKTVKCVLLLECVLPVARHVNLYQTETYYLKTIGL
jgi:hypothetical protein